MKKHNILSFILLLGLASCSVEAPFTGAEERLGKLSKAAINLDISNDESVVSRAGSDEYIKDFIISFQSDGKDVDNVGPFVYGTMPEVITLPAGTYTVTATYGDNQDADFEKPHFKGVSGSFTVEANKINTEIGVIKCKLENIKVSIIFDSSLVSHMDNDAYVEVSVNNKSPLRFTKQHDDDGVAGYFKHYGENTLTATFIGKVDGVMLNVPKTLSDVENGKHYQITFKRHDYQGEDSGNIEGGIDVDASVTTSDINGGNAVVGEDEPLDDKERPREDDPSNDNENNDQNNPGGDPSEQEPNNQKVLVELDEQQSTVKFDIINNINEDSKIILNIKSNSEQGLTKFLVAIDTEAEDLQGMSNLDLIDPGENIVGLQNLGLLAEGQETLKGETELVFDISGFMDLLCGLGSYKHTFTLTIGDEFGDVVKTLILNVE